MSGLVVAVVVVLILLLAYGAYRWWAKPSPTPQSFAFSQYGPNNPKTGVLACSGRTPRLNIAAATYGMPDPQPEGCTRPDVTAAFNKKLAGASTYTWPGYADDFAGDPCPGHPKTLSGTYLCAP